MPSLFMFKMSFKSVVRISKLQTKNRMVGKTFNPKGHTLESLDKRDADFLESFYKMSYEEKKKMINGLKKLVKHCELKGWSFPFEYSLLEQKGLLDLEKLKGGLKK